MIEFIDTMTPYFMLISMTMLIVIVAFILSASIFGAVCRWKRLRNQRKVKDILKEIAYSALNASHWLNPTDRGQLIGIHLMQYMAMRMLGTDGSRTIVDGQDVRDIMEGKKLMVDSCLEREGGINRYALIPMETAEAIATGKLTYLEGKLVEVKEKKPAPIVIPEGADVEVFNNKTGDYDELKSPADHKPEPWPKTPDRPKSTDNPQRRA